MLTEFSVLENMYLCEREILKTSFFYWINAAFQQTWPPTSILSLCSVREFIGCEPPFEFSRWQTRLWEKTIWEEKKSSGGAESWTWDSRSYVSRHHSCLWSEQFGHNAISKKRVMWCVGSFSISKAGRSYSCSPQRRSSSKSLGCGCKSKYRSRIYFITLEDESCKKHEVWELMDAEKVCQEVCVCCCIKIGGNVNCWPVWIGCRTLRRQRAKMSHDNTGLDWREECIRGKKKEALGDLFCKV